MIRLLETLWRQRQLVRAFVVRDLKSRYVGSSMGFFWSVIVPFIYLFVFMVVFNLFMNSRWTDDARPQDTALFMLVGILSWHAFAETLARTTGCLVDNANLIQKVVFPAGILPAYLTISSIVNMLIGLPIVIVGTISFTGQAPTVTYAALPVLIALQAVFSLGLGYLLSTLNLFLRDTLHLIGVLTLVWMFATPIFYPPSLVEKASVPLPGTDQTVERWLTEEMGRRRVPLPGKATLLVEGKRPPRHRWELEGGFDEVPRDVAEFLRPRAEDDRALTAATLRREPPEDLDAYVVLAGVYHHRETVEESERMSLGFLLDLNPMFWLVNSYRRVIMFGQWPDWGLVGRLAAVALAMLVIGGRFFAKHQKRFPDLL